MSGHSIVSRIGHNIILSTGKWRAANAFLAGLVGSASLAPLNFYPALFVTMTVAIWLVDGSVAGSRRNFQSLVSTLKSVALAGWWLGFGYFLGGLWWLGAAFLVEADKFAWALPLGVVGLPAVLALFTALGFVISWIFWSSGSGRIFALAVGLGLSEWMRSVVLSGFPWNNFGMALGGNLYLGQIASIVGLHGLTAIAIALAAAPATMLDAGRARTANLRYGPTAVAIAVVGLLGAFGLFRVNSSPTVFLEGPKLRLMQPNLPQDEKFRSDRGMEILDRYLKLSDRSTSPQNAGIASVTHLFWPESPFPFILSQNPEALAKIGKFLPSGTVLVTGAARAEQNAGGAPVQRRASVSYFNSIHVLAADGVIAQSYDKIRLVPFGEFLPFESMLRSLGVEQFVHIPGGFTSGSGRSELNLPRIGKVTPLICYEAIFPGLGQTGRANAERARLLVNVTNDGWFGSTSGPYQHLLQARLRTIEEGVPMIRVANTGVSAVIDPVGRIVRSLPLGAEGVLDTEAPDSIPRTFFSRFRTEAPAGLFLLLAILAILTRRYKNQ